ncbi:hypothetical protein B0A52_06555 [Exophiala mesophila]|uniref:F-box domain-containing protein n=1 Tax=Exophiala mesophila TaxID=212818 RepID=A0A438N182_EXOME|nr:hypothetical protein B0A52_06555 [Exophiala mesophila]
MGHPLPTQGSCNENVLQSPSITAPSETTTPILNHLLPSTHQGSSTFSESDFQDALGLAQTSQGNKSTNDDLNHSQYVPTGEVSSTKRKAAEELHVSIGSKKVFKYRRSYGSAPEKSPLNDNPLDRLPPLTAADDFDPWTLANSSSSEEAQNQTVSFNVTGPNGQTVVVAVNLNEVVNHPSVAEVMNSPAQSALASESDRPSSTSDTAESGRKKVGFLDLPFEMRDRIYRSVLVDDDPIDFYARHNLSHSSALLRTCKTVHNEATDVLYGSNSFHFKRQTQYRGKYFDEFWYEVGYEDVRRFFETIGPVNISKMNYLSLKLTDGLKLNEPGMSAPKDQLRFVTDPNLQHVFNLIGKNTVLERFGVIFGGRCQVNLSDFHFLKALSSIKCYKLDILSQSKNNDLGSMTNRISATVQDRLEEIMVVARTDTDTVDQSKKKVQVKLAYVPEEELWASDVRGQVTTYGFWVS